MSSLSNITPGSLHSDSDFRRELVRRSKIVHLCRKERDFKANEKALCSRHPVHFINNWGFTFDPRLSPFHFPFRLYDFQEELINWMVDLYRKKEKGLIEKTRDMGATWCVMSFFVWGYLFEPGFIARLGSRVEDEVDDSSIDSLFGKVRYLIRHLPPFMQPSNQFVKTNDKHLMLKNGNGNLMLGESASPNFGRSGRSRVALLDEFAFVQHSEEVWASISETSDTIFTLSTPNGQDNMQYWLRHESGIATIALHWTRHPKKDTAWYEKKKQEMPDWQVAQELDISYERSKKGRIYRRFDRAYHVSKRPIKYDKMFEQAVTWDFGYGGAMAIVWIQIGPTGKIEVWNYFEIAGQDIDFCVPVSMGIRPAEYVLLDDKDKKAVDAAIAKVPQHFRDRYDYGDNAGVASTANSKRSCRDAIKAAGLTFKSSGKQTYDWRIKCLDNLLKLKQNRDAKWESQFEVSSDLQRLIDCLNNYVWASDNIEGDTVKPKIDWASHGVTALEFFAINRFPLKKSVANGWGSSAF